MAYTTRPESFLPTIKCSTCGIDIDLSALADHVCAGPTEPAEKAPGTGFLGRFANTQTHAIVSAPSSSSLASKLGRSRVPPQIDSVGANRAYLEPVPTTPSTYGNAYRDTPPTSSDAPMSPRIKDSISTRSVRNAPPSPPMSMGYDNPFPPWPASPAVEAPSRDKSLREHDQNSLNPPRNPRLESAPHTDQPLKSPGLNVMKRMNTIARGPFDPRPHAPKSVANETRDASFGHRRTKTSDSAKSFRSRSSYKPTERPSTSYSKRSQTSIYSDSSISGLDRASHAFEDEPPVPSLPRFSVAESSQPNGTMHQIDGQPTKSANESSAAHMSSHMRSMVYPEDRQPKLPNVSIPEVSVPISSTNTASQIDVRIHGAPPVPRLPGLQTQFPGIASAHSPSESASSNGSVFSSGSSHSSRSSPPASEADSWTRRPSDASMVHDQPTLSQNSSGRIMALRGAQVDSTQPMPQGEQRSQTVNAPPPSRRLSRDLETEAKLSSSLDSAFQHGIFGSGRRPSAPNITRAPIDKSPSRSGVQRHATTASRAPCRGCTMPIVGKAIKASDGRISGRWHKECFVCLTCKAPFPTGDFYVLNDQPYCERHYHTLNGSLCGACDGGIEGQYLETDRGKKYHKLCFTCDACDIPLRDEYYEVSGKQYCERHAWAVAQRNAGLDPSGRGYRNGYGGGARLEKRSTRLMMM